MKWLKIEYNQTGKTCKNPFCRVRAVSRYNTAADFGCDLQRPIYGGFVSFLSLECESSYFSPKVLRKVKDFSIYLGPLISG